MLRDFIRYTWSGGVQQGYSGGVGGGHNGRAEVTTLQTKRVKELSV